MGLRPSRLVLVAVGGAGGVTLLAALGPFELAHRNLALHVAVETAAGLVAAFAAFLVFGRFRQQGRLGDLLLACALAAFAVVNLVLSVLPSIAAAAPGRFWTWAPLAARLLATAALAASPFLLGRIVRDRHRGSLAALAVLVTGFAAVALGVGSSASLLPLGVDPALSPGVADWPDGAHLAILAGHLVAAALFATAALGFTLRAGRTGDEFMRWLGLGSVLAAFAHLNYVLFPSLYSPWIATGDILRIAFYALVVVGAAREIAAYQHERAGVAVLQERRRLAREMHDGLAQELAYVLTQVRLLAMRQPETPGLAEIESAAQRALDESRVAIAALTRPGREPLGVAVAGAAEEVARRAGVQLRLDLADGVEASAELREAMVRIVSEAISNAARHGNADEVRVELVNGADLRLTVTDGGTGFDPVEARARRSGFGLTSMRERAEALGGELTVDSRPGAGTRVEVVVR